jgi:hypothetical protein
MSLATQLRLRKDKAKTPPKSTEKFERNESLRKSSGEDGKHPEYYCSTVLKKVPSNINVIADEE